MWELMTLSYLKLMPCVEARTRGPHPRRDTLRIRILVVAAAATIALLTAGTPTWAAPHANQPFAEQAAAAHLTPAQTATLQGKVNDYLKVVGGKQVALNRIVFSGGELRVALPGEAHPRNLEPSAVAASDP